MEELTVQTTAALTEAPVADTDCDPASAGTPSQDTLSSQAEQPLSASTDNDSGDRMQESVGTPTQDTTFMPIYKGKVYPMRAADAQEITTLLQLGMKQREWQPLLEDLQALAECCGAKNARELIERSVEAYDRHALDHAVRLHGEEKGRALFESVRDRVGRRAAETSTEEKQTLHERLATEFVALRSEFPAYTSISELPDEVLETALTAGVPLTDALLRFEHREQRRVQAEKEASARAAAAGIGSLQQAANGGHSSAMEAFLKGLHQRL